MIKHMVLVKLGGTHTERQREKGRQTHMRNVRENFVGKRRVNGIVESGLYAKFNQLK